MIACPSENGYVFFWPIEKQSSKKRCFCFADKQTTSKSYEYCYPFQRNSKLGSLDKCTVVIQVPEEVRKMYCDRLSEVKGLERSLRRMVIFISQHGHIKVCADVDKMTIGS